ncbi:MAG: peptidylprolyl isomerase [Betaproteobacteria bacterium]|nr:peptidylprolyl isomerase [Betaproteobacteria bacterium]
MWAVATVPGTVHAQALVAKPTFSYSELLAASKPGEWRALDLENTLYMDLPSGRVVIEISAAYAPAHAANLRALAREGYFDGLAIVRSQDNYVAQWADPDEKNPRPMKQGKRSLAPEFTRAIDGKLAFTPLPDIDGYAPQVGFSNGFPVGRNPKTGQTWLAHCYGMVGAGRDNAETSGSGAELYAVTGHAPRHLDRNITLLGRVVLGMSLLSTLPRGTGALGFSERAEQRVPIKSVRVAGDGPAGERTNLAVIRTDTPLFTSLVEALRNRGGTWYKVPAGHIELCNVPIAVRPVAVTAK